MNRDECFARDSLDEPPNWGGVEGIMYSIAVLKAQGCNQEIVTLDSPYEPWVKTAELPLYAMGIRNP